MKTVQVKPLVLFLYVFICHKCCSISLQLKNTCAKSCISFHNQFVLMKPALLCPFDKGNFIPWPIPACNFNRTPSSPTIRHWFCMCSFLPISCGTLSFNVVYVYILIHVTSSLVISAQILTPGSLSLLLLRMIEANKVHYFSTLFWYTILHVSDRLTVHHQESQHCIHSNRYLSY